MICIIVALLCWGFWGIFDKKALEKSTSQNVIITHYVLHGVQIPILICVLNLIAPGWCLTASVMLWAGLAAVAYAVASVAYLIAMSKAEASYVLGVTACYPVIAIGLAVIFLGETLIIERLIGAAVVCLGVYAISLPTAKKEKLSNIGMNKIMTVCIVLATIAWAVWGIIDKRAVSVAGPLEVCLAKYIWDLFILPIMLRIYRKQGHVIDICNRRTIFFCSLSATCLALGAWAYLTAMTHYSASYVISITACYPVLMYVLAIIFLKECFNRQRFIGIALIVIGGVFVQNAQYAQAIDRSSLDNLKQAYKNYFRGSRAATLLASAEKTSLNTLPPRMSLR